MSAAVMGDLFDGVTSAAQRVRVAREGDTLLIEGEGVRRSVACATLRGSGALGATARSLTFPDGATLLVAHAADIESLLQNTSLSKSLLARITAHKLWLLWGTLALIATITLGYASGLPWAARRMAAALPPSALNAIGAGAIDAFDRLGFAPTKLAESRRNEIERAFAGLTPHIGSARVKRLTFRSSPQHGANAVALPDGTIVVTDELVALAQNDTQIMGVLCHELGHVHHRHGAQNVIEGGLIAGFLSVYLGDFSAIATGALATLAASHYSRDAERQADDYAIAMMKKNKLPPAAFAQLLARMDNDYRAKKKVGQESKKTLSDYFSSHPATAERIARIEAAK
jgi:Zn-dependent protease with chaperone function